MQQKFTEVIATLILHSRHVSTVHAHHQVSIVMLNCCIVLHVTVVCVQLWVLLNYNYNYNLQFKN
jgi:hypothetical protein